MDGVRLNQPFGEVVSWDLIPRLAIALDHADAGLESAVRPQHARRRALAPDQGRPHASPARRVQATYGSDVRRALEVEHGGQTAANGLHWYVAGNLFERGRLARRLAVRRAADLRQARLAARPAADRRVSVGHANNSLTGNGLQDCRLLDRDYASVYTKPDITDNRSTLLNVVGPAHRERAACRCSGNAYYRDIRTEQPQRRHQRGVARSVDLSAGRGRAGGAGRGRLRQHPGQRPRRQQHAVSRRCAASATCCSTTSRRRSATA